MPNNFIYEMQKRRKQKQRIHFKDDLKSSFRDIYEFYIDPKKRHAAEKVPKIIRWLYLSFWLAIGIVKTLSLSNFRWMLVAISFFLFVDAENNSSPLAYFILFLVLLLELKDKIIAKDELQAGSAVQTALMPEQKPAIPGWDVWLYTRPANHVGGDYLDCIPLAEKTYLAIGDVSGKGLPAALLMAKLQASVQALAPITSALDEITTQLNKLVCANALKNKFISFFALTLHQQNNKIAFVNAGHMPPFLLHNGRVLEFPKGNLALGLMAKTTFEIKQFELQPGDTFLAYTDGISEARNEQGDFYSEQRVKNTLQLHQQKNAEEIGLALLSDIRKFMGKAVLHDDLTMIVLQKKR